MLKIFSQQPSTTTPADKTAPEAPVQYIFSFTSPTNARPEADAIKEALGVAIQVVKAAQTPETNGAPAAKAADDAARLSDSQLKSDAELQQTLLKSDPDLKRVFMESLRTKPESVTSGQFVSQFWSTRVHLLRAHAIERSQTRGSYNVLSSLKPRVEDNVTRLNISKEQIQLIFNQHPLVKKVYDENVPKLTEAQFWSRFFQSRLFKKLRGERITESDATDSLLDKYLRADEHTGRLLQPEHLPHIIDLEGNEENHSQRLGNRPNFDMRPTPLDKVPIIRTLNSLSEKIMGNVAPADRGPTDGGDEVDAEMFNELQLRDLRGDDEQSRIMLNIRDQSRFFTDTKQAETEESRIYSKQDPAAILGSLRKDINTTYRNSDRQGISLTKLVEPEEDDDSSDEEKAGSRKQPVGSKASLAGATVQIFEAIRQRKKQGESDSSSDTCGLSVGVYDRLTLTHATTTEFLNQFWQAFLSGDPDRAGEVASLVESLNRAMDRIKAVADEAEGERQAEVEKLKKHAREVMASTGKNIRPNLKGVGGGEKIVNQLMTPTIKALGKATAEYKKAFAQQTNEARQIA